MTRESHFAILKSEISAELTVLDRLVVELENYLKDLTFDRPGEGVIIRAAGSILHDFYTCVERIFKRIAQEMDDDLPSGSSWHSNLLERMSLKIDKIRPAVISSAMKNELYEYMRFRHVFRNVYGEALQWDRIKALMNKLPEIASKVKEELGNFLSMVDELKK